MPQIPKKIILLLTPSWPSGLVAIVGATIIVASNYFRSRSDIGALAEGIQGFQTLAGPIYHRLTDSLAHNNLASNLPLLLFWAAVGAAVYVVAVRLFTAFSDTAALEQTMFYSNVKRDSFLESLAVSYGLRLAALFSWFIYCAIFFKSILPMATTAARNAAQVGTLAHNTGLLGTTLGLVLALHLHVIFARLIMLRLRVFSDASID